MCADSVDKRKNAEVWGKEAEQIAADYLLGLGYTIRERNWKVSGRFEIDIIAQHEDNIILVEVKARDGRHTEAVDAVDSHKMRQMVRAADAYIGKLSEPYYYRFDIVAITGDRNNYKLDHYPNAFLSPLSGS